jgi:NADH-quinone oxidoreductase subunit J
MNQAVIDTVLLVAFVVAAVWSVLTARLLRAVVALAATSVLVTCLMFRLDSPLASVFELSVCAGLVSAIFLGTITLTQPENESQLAATSKERIRRYWYLPPLLVLSSVALLQLALPSTPNVAVSGEEVRKVLWSTRHLDLFGQITVLVAGAFGVVVLFKETRKNER